MVKREAVRAKRLAGLLAPCSLPHAKLYRPIARDGRGLLLGLCPPRAIPSLSFEASLHSARVIVQPFQPRQLRNARSERAQRPLFGLNDGRALEKVVGAER